MAAAFTLAYVPVAAPILQARPDFASFATSDLITTLIGALILCALLAPLAGEKLAGESASKSDSITEEVLRAK